MLDSAIHDLQVSETCVAWRAWDGQDYEIYARTADGLRQVTENETYDGDLRLSGSRLVWRNGTGANAEIFTVDVSVVGSDPAPVTRNSSADTRPDIDGDWVVWLSDDGSGDEVHRHNLTTGETVQVSDSSYDAKYPRVRDGRVTWYASDGHDYEIWLYENGSARRVTGNLTDDFTPELSDTHIIWRGQGGSDAGDDEEIFLYDIAADTTTQLTADDFSVDRPVLSETTAAWMQHDGDDYEIVRYQIASGQTTTLTDNDKPDRTPAVSSDMVAWLTFDGSDYEVYRHEPATGTQRLTNNDLADEAPRVAGRFITWPSSVDEVGQVSLRDVTRDETTYFTSFSITAEPTLRVGNVSMPEGNSGPHTLAFEVRLSAPTDHEVTCRYATVDLGSATPEVDYTPVSGQLRFLPGDVAKTVEVTVFGEIDVEDDETFGLELTDVLGAVLLDGSAIATLVDDDKVELSIDDHIQLIEGADGQTDAIFRVRVSRPVSVEVRVSYAMTDGTATAGEDYEPISGTLTFSPGGSVSQTLAVPVFGDIEPENNETFSLVLSDPVAATLASGASRKTATILNDDTRVGIAAGDGMISRDEGADGETTVYTVHVVLSHALTEPLTVEYATGDAPDAEHHAEPDDGETEKDYQPKTGTLTFQPGQTSLTANVLVHGDDLIEPTERLAFYVSLPVGVGAGVRLSETPMAILEIVDDDTPRLAISDCQMFEGDDGFREMQFVVTLDRMPGEGQDITVAYATDDDSAVFLTGDYQQADGVLTFSAAEGVLSKTVSVIIYGDREEEVTPIAAEATSDDGEPDPPRADDDIAFVLRNAAETLLDVLANDTAAPDLGQTISLTDVSEGDQGGAVGIDPDSGAIRYQPAAGFTGVETFTYTITDDDGLTDTATVAVTVGTVDSPVTEDDTASVLGATGSHRIEVLANDNWGVGPAEALTISAVTQGVEGGAVAIGDSGAYVTYTPPIGFIGTDRFTYTVTDGEGLTRSATVEVAVSRAEAHERFFVTLSNAVNATIIDGQAEGLIRNDDTTASVTSARVIEGDTGTIACRFLITLSQPIGLPVMLAFATRDDTALADAGTGEGENEQTIPGDYVPTQNTIVFDAYAMEREIIVNVRGDAEIEPDESFQVDLSEAAPFDGEHEDPDAYAVAIVPESTSAAGTILDDDTPAVTVEDASVVEDNSGVAVEMAFTVRLSRANTDQAITVDYTTADDPDAGHPAEAGADYAITTGTITFEPGQTENTIVVPIIADSGPEGDETFLLALTGTGGAILDDAEALGTILNNDGILRISSVSRNEGTGLPTPFVFAVELDFATCEEVRVDYHTPFLSGDGVAAMGADFEPVSGTLIFAPGQTRKDIIVNVAADGYVEETETFRVVLENPTNAAFEGDAETIFGVGEIIDDDVPRVQVESVTVVESEGFARFAVQLNSAPASGSLQVQYETIDESAVAGSDYTHVSGTLSFNDQTTTSHVEVPILDDDNSEPDEAFTLRLSYTFDGTPGVYDVEAFIRNDDASITVEDAEVDEGDDGTFPLRFRVRLAHASAVQTTMNYAVVESDPASATAGADYTASAGILTINPGATEAFVDVPIVGDTLNEADETFAVVLTNPTHGSLVDAEALGTIANDDEMPTLSLAATPVPEGDEGSTPGIFRLSLDRPSGQSVSVDYAIAGGSATPGVDFTAAGGGTVTFAPGETEQTIIIAVTGDTLVEPDETVRMTLSDLTNATVGTAQADLHIVNDDQAETLPTVSAHADQVNEGDAGITPASFSLTLDKPWSSLVTVSYNIAGGSAIAGSDYTVAAATGTITFQPGQTSRTLPVSILGDTLIEADETIRLTLSSPTQAQLGTALAELLILNDDAMPTISVQGARVSEGDAGTAQTAFTLALDKASSSAVSVRYSIAGGSAIAGSDYTAAAATGTVTFAAGETLKTIAVTVLGDTQDEPDETVHLTLSNPTGATLGTSQAEILILNDDTTQTVPAISVEAGQVNEGNAGTTPTTFRLRLSEPSGVPVSVSYSLIGGTATVGDDYTVVTPGTITFAAGAVEQTLSVSVLGDTLVEPDETIRMMLSNPVNATLATAEAELLILNDDEQIIPNVSVTGRQVTEGHTDTRPTTFLIRLDRATTTTASVRYTLAGGTASAGVDYTAATSGTVSFAPGVTEQAVVVTILGDALVESTETIRLTLSNPVGCQVGVGQADLQILDDDVFPRISIEAPQVVEGDAGATAAAFRLTLSAPYPEPISVRFGIAGGTATAGSDYTMAASAGTVTFAANAIEQTIPLSILGDTLVEQDETIRLALSNPANATLTATQVEMRILNDDTPPTIHIEAPQITEGEVGSTQTAFRITLDRPYPLPVYVSYSLIGGSATIGEDYTVAATTGTLMFDANLTERSIPINVLGDTIVEPDETVRLTLSNPTNAVLDDTRADLRILDDEVLVSVAPAVLAEGADGSTNMAFPVHLSASSSSPVTVRWIAAPDDSASHPATDGEDFDANDEARELVIPAGETAGTIFVPVRGDAMWEYDESFLVRLVGADGAALDPSACQAAGEILNDDAMPLAIPADISTTEGDEDSTLAVAVTLSNPTCLPVTLTWRTEDDTASADDDYLPVAEGELIIPAGGTTGQITLTVYGDGIAEADERFFVALLTGDNAEIGADRASVLLLDDDDLSALPQVSTDDVALVEGDTGQSELTFTVSLAGPVEGDITIDYTTIDGSAIAGEDYQPSAGTITFTPEGPATATITILITGDMRIEPDETFTVSLSAEGGEVGLADAEALGTILNDDHGTIEGPDLALTFSRITLDEWTVPGSRGNVRLALSNQGDAKVRTRGTLRLYASTDLVIDDADVVMAEATGRRVRLKPGRTGMVSFRVTVGQDVPSGQVYYLLAEFTPDEPTGDAKPGNNIAIDPAERRTDWYFGSLPFGGQATLKVNDSHGTPVKLKLNGGGWGEVIDRESFSTIVLHETTARTRAVIRTKGGRTLTLGGLTADGSVRQINAPTATINGAVALGGAKKLLLGDATDATVTLGGDPGANQAVKIKAGTWTDVALVSDVPVGALKVTTWRDIDETVDVLQAPSIGKLFTTARGTGHFAPDITLEGDLGKARIRGDVKGEWNMAGAGSIRIDGDMVDTMLLCTGMTGRDVSLGALRVGGWVRNSQVRTSASMGRVDMLGAVGSDFLAGLDNAVGRYPTDASGFLNAEARVGAFRIRGQGSARAFVDSNLAGAKLGTVSLRNVDFVSQPGLFAHHENGREIGVVRYRDSASGERWTFRSTDLTPPAGREEFIRIL